MCRCVATNESVIQTFSNTAFFALDTRNCFLKSVIKDCSDQPSKNNMNSRIQVNYVHYIRREHMILLQIRKLLLFGKEKLMFPKMLINSTKAIPKRY